MMELSCGFEKIDTESGSLLKNSASMSCWGATAGSERREGANERRLRFFSAPTSRSSLRRYNGPEFFRRTDEHRPTGCKIRSRRDSCKGR